MKLMASEPDHDASPIELGKPALRAFFALAAVWRLSKEEQMKLLGLTDSSMLQSWEAGRVSDISRDTLERISYLLGIFKAVNTLLQEPTRADAWMRTPNKAPLFGGRSALERMVAGNVGDLFLVRRYLEGQLG